LLFLLLKMSLHWPYSRPLWRLKLFARGRTAFWLQRLLRDLPLRIFHGSALLAWCAAALQGVSVPGRAGRLDSGLIPACESGSRRVLPVRLPSRQGGAWGPCSVSHHPRSGWEPQAGGRRHHPSEAFNQPGR